MGQIRQAGNMGRAELARACGLSIQAVSNIIASLIADELLRESGQINHGRGLPAPQYAINPDGAQAIGFEVSPTSITAALLDIMGNTLLTKRERLFAGKPERVGEQVNKLMHSMVDTAGTPLSRLLGAGVVMPGPFNSTGLANTVSVIPGWQTVDAEQLFHQILNVPVLIENDANAAALNERVSCKALSLNNYAFIYFGTGIGLGVVHDGCLFRGAGGNAGEIGHIMVPAPVSGSSSSACSLESIASLFSLVRHLRSLNFEVSSTETIDLLMKQQNPKLLSWLQDAAGALSHAIHVVENLFDPETIILGGALPDSVIKDLMQRMSLASLSIAERDNRRLPRVMCGLSGQLSAARGGAALVINQLYTPQTITAS